MKIEVAKFYEGFHRKKLLFYIRVTSLSQDKASLWTCGSTFYSGIPPWKWFPPPWKMRYTTAQTPCDRTCESHHRLADLFSNSGRSWLIAWLLGAWTRLPSSRWKNCDEETIVRIMGRDTRKIIVQPRWPKIVLIVHMRLIFTIKWHD